MNAYDYIKLIKKNYVNRKTIPFIDDIIIYTHFTKVYKVVIRYNENLKRQLRKHNIEHYILILLDTPKINIIDKPVIEAKPENLTIIYSNIYQLITVVSGEERISLINSS